MAISHFDPTVPVTMIENNATEVFHCKKALTVEIGSDGTMLSFAFSGTSTADGHGSAARDVLDHFSMEIDKEFLLQEFRSLIDAHGSYRGKRIIRWVPVVNSECKWAYLDIRNTFSYPVLVLSCPIPRPSCRIEFVFNGVMNWVRALPLLPWEFDFLRSMHELGLGNPTETPVTPPKIKEVPTAKAAVFVLPPWKALPGFYHCNDKSMEDECVRVFVDFVAPCQTYAVVPTSLNTEEYYCCPYVTNPDLYSYIEAALGMMHGTTLLVNCFMAPISRHTPKKKHITGIIHAFSTLGVPGGLLNTLQWANDNLLTDDSDILTYKPAKILLEQLRLMTPFTDKYPEVIIPASNDGLKDLSWKETILAIIARMKGYLPRKTSVIYTSEWGSGVAGGGSAAAPAPGEEEEEEKDRD
jgi:hypothetical protein